MGRASYPGCSQKNGLVPTACAHATIPRKKQKNKWKSAGIIRVCLKTVHIIATYTSVDTRSLFFFFLQAAWTMHVDSILSDHTSHTTLPTPYFLHHFLHHTSPTTLLTPHFLHHTSHTTLPTPHFPHHTSYTTLLIPHFPHHTSHTTFLTPHFPHTLVMVVGMLDT